MVLRYRQFSKRQQGLDIDERFVLFTDSGLTENLGLHR